MPRAFPINAGLKVLPHRKRITGFGIQKTSRLLLRSVVGLLVYSVVFSSWAKSWKFDIAEGEASETLRQFAMQSHQSLIYTIEDVKGVVTRRLSGKMEPSEALKLMLQDTSLGFIQDASGAYAILRKDDAETTPSRNPQSANSKDSTHTNPKQLEDNNMNDSQKNRKTLMSRIGKAFGALLMAGSTTSTLAQDSATEDQDVYELSPFVISEDENIGYLATSTLAGTRLNTSLRDVGASISVMTEEFFDDVGATDSTTLLSYALNTETSGAYGNFAGGNDAVQGGERVDLSASRTNPQRGQRVRGLASADLTRNYFETDIAFDSYNTERVTINRGPNSLLFGIGSPGGIINNSTMQASVTKNFGEFSIRLGERSSHRETFNYNRVLVDNRLAFRIAGLHEKFNHQQRPTYDEKERFYGALEAVLFENKNSNFLDRTVFRANFETGNSNSNPPQITPPGDGISAWFELPSASKVAELEGITGSTFPGFFTDSTFRPKATYDQRDPGTARSDYNNVVDIPNFIQISLIYEQLGGSQAPGLTGSDLEGSVMRSQYNRNGDFPGRRVWDYFVASSLYSADYAQGFVTKSLPSSVFDNENMALHGNTNLVTRDFDAQNYTLEQTFFGGKAGIEFSYDKQSYSTFRRFPFNAGGFAIAFNDILVDIQEYRNDDTPNPNVGRLMAVSSQSALQSILGGEYEDVDRDATRLTAFYDLDFRDSEKLSWLGRHIFTGVISRQTRDTSKREEGAAWVSDALDISGSNFHFHGIDGSRRQVVSQVYLSDPLHNNSSINSINDLKITNYVNIDLPENGQTYNVAVYDRFNGGFQHIPARTVTYDREFTRTKREVKTKVISMQSYLLNDHIVGLVGFRTDEQTTWQNIPNVENEDGSLNFAASNELDRSRDPLTGDVLDPEEGDTLTWSIVAHAPDSWTEDFWGAPRFSVHYNDSENFNPVGARTDIDGTAISSPSGKTKEYGFSVELLDNRFTARVNWFETTISNDSAAIDPDTIHGRIGNWLSRWQEGINDQQTIQWMLAGTPGNPEPNLWSSYEEAFNAFIGLLPARTQALYNYRVEPLNTIGADIEDNTDLFPNSKATRDFVSKGIEIDLIANPTKNWRIMLNIGKQETVQSNIAPKTAAVAAEIDANLRASRFIDLRDAPTLGEASTFRSRWAGTYGNLLAELAQEGTASLEQREWRINAVTSYDFTDGRLAGFGVGGALRWQSEIATGYPLEDPDNDGINTPDLSRPFFGDPELNGDLWVSYKRKIYDGKIDWKIQLNVRNLIGGNDNIPVITNPDGELAVFRNPLPQEVFLTNTFSF